jgi:hypothetical protein
VDSSPIAALAACDGHITKDRDEDMDQTIDSRQRSLEVIAAFADGERVDTGALRDALSDAAGRDYLIDLIAMREVISGAAGAAGAAGASGASGASGAASARSNRALIGLAAAVAMAVGLGGYTIGQQRARLVPVATHAPLAPDVTVSVEAPPPPTHVIQLGNGKPDGGGR